MVPSICFEPWPLINIKSYWIIFSRANVPEGAISLVITAIAMISIGLWLFIQSHIWTPRYQPLTVKEELTWLRVSNGYANGNILTSSIHAIYFAARRDLRIGRVILVPFSFSLHSVVADQLQSNVISLSALNLTAVAGSPSYRRPFDRLLVNTYATLEFNSSVTSDTEVYIPVPLFLDTGNKILTMIPQNMSDQAFQTTGKLTSDSKKPEEKLFLCSGQLFPLSDAYKTKCFVDVTKCRSGYASKGEKTGTELVTPFPPNPPVEPSPGRDVSDTWSGHSMVETSNIALFIYGIGDTITMDPLKRYWDEIEIVQGSKTKERRGLNCAPESVMRNSTSKPLTRMREMGKMGSNTGQPRIKSLAKERRQFPGTKKNKTYTLLSDFKIQYDVVTFSDAGLTDTLPTFPAFDEATPIAATRAQAPLVIYYGSYSAVQDFMSCYHQILVCDATIENGLVQNTSACVPAPFFCENGPEINCDKAMGIGALFRTDTSLASAVQGTTDRFGEPSASIEDFYIDPDFYASGDEPVNLILSNASIIASKKFERALGLLHMAWMLSSISIRYDPQSAGEQAVEYLRMSLKSFQPPVENATLLAEVEKKIFQEAYLDESRYLHNFTMKVLYRNPVAATAVDIFLVSLVSLVFIVSVLSSAIIAVLNRSEKFIQSVKQRRLLWDPVEKYRVAKIIKSQSDTTMVDGDVKTEENLLANVPQKESISAGRLPPIDPSTLQLRKSSKKIVPNKRASLHGIPPAKAGAKNNSKPENSWSENKLQTWYAILSRPKKNLNAAKMRRPLQSKQPQPAGFLQVRSTSGAGTSRGLEANTRTVDIASLRRRRNNEQQTPGGLERRPTHHRNPIMRKAGQPLPVARTGEDCSLFEAALCPDSRGSTISDAVLNQNDHLSLNYRNNVVIYGYIYDFSEVRDRLAGRGNIQLTTDWLGRDLTPLFQTSLDACSGISTIPVPKCSIENRFPGSPSLEPNPGEPCPSYSWLEGLKPTGRAFFSWQDVFSNTEPPHTLIVFNGAVLNLTTLLRSGREYFHPNFIATLNRVVGTDATRGLSFSYSTLASVNCLKQRYIVGYLDKEPIGCVATQAIQSVCLAVILCVVMTRFLMAITFHWFISERLTKLRGGRNNFAQRTPQVAMPLDHQAIPMSVSGRLSTGIPYLSLGQRIRPKAKADDHYTIMLVTCYSEGEEGIRNTLESLASTDYPDTHKLLFVVADGLITGFGNSVSTPDAIISMISQNESMRNPEPKSYLAIADGAKQHNMAKVYAGLYHHNCGGRVPIIAVVKCGTQAEQNERGQKKAGNRGKRDSQLILMNFLSRVMFNDRMTPLDYELSWKIPIIAGGATPDLYTLTLMVDADTKVAPDSLKYMVQAMKNDKTIMGLCGETRIANKRTSWVTAIQVFEYYISHHLGKAFESVFGGVTCLPGCFCMYRIKAPKGPHGAWMVPILANPDIVDEYSENVVDTLHKKNLLLLGEDRFLTTLMLRTFPKRKMIFVPQAICRTVVPDTFKMLLSQRRRWINSTIHNLLELVLLRDLCGIFCFSMQFIVMLELIGTVVLPAAITFVFVLLFSAMITGKVAALPLLMLLATLGLPGLLIVITTRKVVYLLWMVVYIMALPVWNFVLPVYAFWHFDDFSWGETRKVEGEAAQQDHSTRDGEYEIGSVILKSWADWEIERRGGLRNQGNNTSIRQKPIGASYSEPADTVEQVAMSLHEELVPPPKNQNPRTSFSMRANSANWLASPESNPVAETSAVKPSDRHSTSGWLNASLSSVLNVSGEEPKKSEDLNIDKAAAPSSWLNASLSSVLNFGAPESKNTEELAPTKAGWLHASLSSAFNMSIVNSRTPEDAHPCSSSGIARAAEPIEVKKPLPAPTVKETSQILATKPPLISRDAPSLPIRKTSTIKAQPMDLLPTHKVSIKRAQVAETTITTSEPTMTGFLMCSTPNISGQVEPSAVFDLFSKSGTAEVELLDECASLESDPSRSDDLDSEDRDLDTKSTRSCSYVSGREDLSVKDDLIESYAESIDPMWDIGTDVVLGAEMDQGLSRHSHAVHKEVSRSTISITSTTDKSRRKKTLGPRPMPFARDTSS
ncbi:Chitin synthase, class 3 [Dinochytrium kinnereticum]|nr:Chitin synthase, class 3 [Dinochytrium kinnereticum]